MDKTITAVYENGVLRPLIPLLLPEHTQVELRIIKPTTVAEDERQQVRQALMAAGVIRPRPMLETTQRVSETDLAEAAQALSQAGPLSELIIAEREGR
jgi:predicted DNA-binding antitoxin AbrB/MazE fold protein